MKKALTFLLTVGLLAVQCVAMAEETEYLSTVADDASATQRVMVVETGNGGRLNMRQEPSAGGKLMDQYANGTPVRVLETSGDWSKVEVNGKTGYMMSKYLTAAETAGQRENTGTQQDAGQGSMIVQTGNGGRLNMRQEPSTGGKLMDQYANGTPVQVLETNGAWSKVEVNGKTGYMMSRYLAPNVAQSPQAERQENMTPPEKPDGEADAAEMPELPELPDNEDGRQPPQMGGMNGIQSPQAGMQENMTLPEKPDGEADAAEMPELPELPDNEDGQQPPQMGGMNGMQPPQMNGQNEQLPQAENRDGQMPAMGGPNGMQQSLPFQNDRQGNLRSMQSMSSGFTTLRN